VDDAIKQLQKKVKKSAFKFLASERGLQTLNSAIKAKRQTDSRLSWFYDVIGLPSLQDKATVEEAVDAQARRIRNLSGDLDDLEQAVDRLEKQLTAKPAPATKKAEKKSTAKTKKKKPQPAKIEPLIKAQPRRKAAKAAAKPAKEKEMPTQSAAAENAPSPAPKKGKRTAPAKSLLADDWKKTPKSKTKK